MRIPKPSDDDVARFRSIVPEDPRVQVKPMFGNHAAFVNGTMFAGLFGSDIGIRLAPEDAERLRAIEGAGSFGPLERPMREYVTLPPSLVGTPDGATWVGRALEHAAALPPKAGRGQPRKG